MSYTYLTRLLLYRLLKRLSNLNQAPIVLSYLK